jgi:hypothetical protein
MPSDNRFTNSSLTSGNQQFSPNIDTSNQTQKH